MEHYYQVNEFLLSSIGQWPYQKKYSKLFFYGSTVFLLATQGFLQVFFVPESIVFFKIDIYKINLS